MLIDNIWLRDILQFLIIWAGVWIYYRYFWKRGKPPLKLSSMFLILSIRRTRAFGLLEILLLGRGRSDYSIGLPADPKHYLPV